MFDVAMLIRSTFNDSNKYYPQVSLEECLYKFNKLTN